MRAQTLAPVFNGRQQLKTLTLTFQQLHSLSWRRRKKRRRSLFTGSECRLQWFNTAVTFSMERHVKTQTRWEVCVENRQTSRILSQAVYYVLNTASQKKKKPTVCKRGASHIFSIPPRPKNNKVCFSGSVAGTWSRWENSTFWDGFRL